jgi:hypothetical protein
MVGAYYLPVESNLTSESFIATEATSGPWDPQVQHGGPPSALLARAAEQAPGGWPATVVRMAIDLLGPVPVGEVQVESRVARSGRSVELVEADLSAAGRVAARSRAWRVRRAELRDLPTAATVQGGAPVVPALPPDVSPAPQNWGGGFVRSMETRFSAGDWNVPGRATLWARFPLPLVAGEATSGLSRLMLLADCGNGVSSALPIADWVFINPELTVHLSRYPQGDWLCIDAATTVDASGFGLAASTLYDATGKVARGAQSLFIDAR